LIDRFLGYYVCCLFVERTTNCSYIYFFASSSFVTDFCFEIFFLWCSGFLWIGRCVRLYVRASGFHPRDFIVWLFFASSAFAMVLVLRRTEDRCG
jgi:hypothetical protein